jgi:hypothetical protein
MRNRIRKEVAAAVVATVAVAVVVSAVAVVVVFLLILFVVLLLFLLMFLLCFLLSRPFVLRIFFVLRLLGSGRCRVLRLLLCSFGIKQYVRTSPSRLHVVK